MRQCFGDIVAFLKKLRGRKRTLRELGDKVLILKWNAKIKEKIAISAALVVSC